MKIDEKFLNKRDKYIYDLSWEPNSVLVGFKDYEDILKSARRDSKDVKYVLSFYGIKVYIDPALKEDEIVFKKDKQL